jgi:hypothetical protein
MALQPPPALVDRAMMSPAQQRQVGKVGGAAVEPVAQVMGLAPGWGSVAAGEGAAAVPDHQGGALGGGHHPAGPADLQRLGRGTPKRRGEQPRRRPQLVRQAPSLATAAVVVAVARVVVVVAAEFLVVTAVVVVAASPAVTRRLAADQAPG